MISIVNLFQPELNNNTASIGTYLVYEILKELTFDDFLCSCYKILKRALYSQEGVHVMQGDPLL